MRYNPNPPYEILQTRLVSFAEMQTMRRFARYWDLVGNSGNFIETTPLLWRNRDASPFAAFVAFSEWLYGRVGRTDSIALARLAELLFEYLTESSALDRGTVAETIARDWQRGGRRDPPEFLRAYGTPSVRSTGTRQRRGPRRQARHWVVDGIDFPRATS
jgi:hypothetical protein